MPDNSYPGGGYGSREDSAMMQEIANTWLEATGDERETGTVVVDGLGSGIDLTNSVTFVGTAKWTTIALQVSEIVINPETDTVTLALTNDLQKVVGYAEQLRRFMINKNLDAIRAAIRDPSSFTSPSTALETIQELFGLIEDAEELPDGEFRIRVQRLNLDGTLEGVASELELRALPDP